MRKRKTDKIAYTVKQKVNIYMVITVFFIYFGVGIRTSQLRPLLLLDVNYNYSKTYINNIVRTGIC